MKKNYFIIVNYNDYDNTYKLINNIKNYKVIEKIVVVDNASTDTSVEMLKKLKIKNFLLLELNQNNGYGAAINYACNYLINNNKKGNAIISNPDVRIEKEEDIEKLTKNINKEIVIAAPIINTYGVLSTGWRIPNIKESIISNLPFFGHHYLEKKILNNKNHFNNKNIMFSEAVSGCFFVIDLNALYNNKFDENLFLYYEENTIAYKLKKQGLKSVIDGNVMVYHDHSKTIDKNINEYKKLSILKESQYYFYKNIVKSNKFFLFLLKIQINIILFIKKLKVGIKN